MKQKIRLYLGLAAAHVLLASCATLSTPPAAVSVESAKVATEERAPLPAPLNTRESAIEMLPFQGKSVTYIHLVPDPSVQAGTVLGPGKTIGRPEPLPQVPSDSPEAVARMLLTDALYAEKRYREAADLLLALRETEWDNPHYLNRLGMACFWAGGDYKASGYAAYQALMRRIQESTPDDEDTVVVDLWFVDAYAKLGTLHLDLREYAQAVTELTKALLGSGGDAVAVMDNWYSYLTEGYFFLGLAMPNRYFYALTKGNNTGNTYVDQYLLAQDARPEADRELRSVVDTLLGLSHRNATAAQILAEAGRRIRSGELELRVDPFLPADIYEGLNLEVARSGRPAVEVAPYILELYEREPSVVLTALAHELAHARSWFAHPDLMASGTENPLERYRYEMDAMYVEALVARDTLAPAGYTLTRFEQALVRSLDQDNLAGFSVFLRGIDMHLAYWLDDGWAEVRRGESEGAAWLDRVERAGREMAERSLPDDPGKKYQELVSRYTYARFVPVILLYAGSAEGKGFADDADFERWVRERHPGISGALEAARAVLLANEEHYEGYRAEVRRSLAP